MDALAEADFERYFRARRDAIRRTAYLMCGDWHRADDHTQAAFVALHRHWRRVRDKGALDAWMRRTLMRAVVDESRRPWRRERFTDDVVAVDKVVADYQAAIKKARKGYRRMRRMGPSKKLGRRVSRAARGGQAHAARFADGKCAWYW